MAPPPPQLLGESFDDIIALLDRRCLAPPPLPLPLPPLEDCWSDDEDDEAPVEEDVMENDSLATVLDVRYESSKLLFEQLDCCCCCCGFVGDRCRFLT